MPSNQTKLPANLCWLLEWHSQLFSLFLLEFFIRLRLHSSRFQWVHVCGENRATKWWFDANANAILLATKWDSSLACWSCCGMLRLNFFRFGCRSSHSMHRKTLKWQKSINYSASGRESCGWIQLWNKSRQVYDKRLTTTPNINSLSNNKWNKILRRSSVSSVCAIPILRNLSIDELSTCKIIYLCSAAVGIYSWMNMLDVERIFSSDSFYDTIFLKFFICKSESLRLQFTNSRWLALLAAREFRSFRITKEEVKWECDGNCIHFQWSSRTGMLEIHYTSRQLNAHIRHTK